MTVVTIGIVLSIAAAFALAGLALPPGVRRPRQLTAWLTDRARQRRAAENRQAAEAAEQIRWSEEVAVAARGAVATAERRRAECQQAQERVADTWQAYQDADLALTRARRAAAYSSLDSVSYPERAKALRRAAQAAHRRGELSDEQLLDALLHRQGWNPELHPVEQELVIAKAAVKYRWEQHRVALEAEADAWRAADVATASVRSLRAEVTAAAPQADEARAALPEATREMPILMRSQVLSRQVA
ncbi:hypothetical protein [Actinoplanes sp. NBRC 103695]|uniref:hypothetical protein n=1 Tax=Actinoplanes sp. NBRC 103695 TaxID=3032202 RepID=UPI0024A067AF|nr:hypothetical protein [Actinoplanes sp. NBRC 103695]GLZ02160.1 hypothetical protein Acsp02_94110 [Actinoplanes sp. NBRC 103695]